VVVRSCDERFCHTCPHLVPECDRGPNYIFIEHTKRIGTTDGVNPRPPTSWSCVLFTRSLDAAHFSSIVFPQFSPVAHAARINYQSFSSSSVGLAGGTDLAQNKCHAVVPNAS
jgi:hypothetical protein